ncbi:MAG TPA: multidrug efflux RND transporter permease subunit [Steroidobacteraceae bacterium]|nr:multidrug efflux RND transporter permease subunit [Steroidobacteraceae bacterium]
MAAFFIDRPVFAWVIAILITVAGVLCVFTLPTAAYPEIAPPQVNISATYPGASAATVETTVTQVIEQQLTGIDNLLYFTSTSNSAGGSQITLTFETGTDPDIAAVQTQNRVALAQPRLPTEVIQQGISVQKANQGFAFALAIKSDDGSLDSLQLNNVLATRVIDQVNRVPGVGSTNQFGSEFAMRIWLNPDKLHGFKLAASEVLARVRQQNVQFASGTVGSQPAVPGQPLVASVQAESRFSSPEQFENIILRADPNGTTVRLKDVARVELGPATYGRDTRLDGKPIAAFAVQVLPGADTLDVARRVKALMDDLLPTLPPGVSWFAPFDSTTFITISIKEVVYTLIAAVVLVFLTMLIFMQSFRATLIPTLVVPVALLGAFIGMKIFDFSINQLSMFGMALAIGIVVDDAIVVIESVERLMREEHLSPKEATRRAMRQLTGAIVTITVVLGAVFVPSALQVGSSGVIYRQFALTIAVSMAFSAFLAMSFTPALCATLLRPEHLRPNIVFRWFNRAYDWGQGIYTRSMPEAIRHLPRWMAAFVALLVAGAFLLLRLPGSFLPEEDQGYAYAIVQMPPGSTIEQTARVMSDVGRVLHESPAVDTVMEVSGFSFVGQGESVGLGFVKLKPWGERDIDIAEFLQWGNREVAQKVKGAQVFMANLPTVRGLSQFGGFDFYLEDRAGLGRPALAAAQTQLLGSAASNTSLANVRPNAIEDAPRLTMTADRTQAEAMGLSVSDVYTAIQLMLAPVYANDFFREGRVRRVLLQADAPYRMGTDALNHFYVPSTLQNGDMVPISSVVKTSWIVAPPSLTRYNGYPAVEITGSSAPGYSSGDAMEQMQTIVRRDLPHGFGFDWAGQSLQEILSGNQAPLLFALSVLVVYLCLCALYESWMIPLSVMLAVPLGIIGAATAATLRGLPNDVFFKVGLITIIGLTAKNAILIVQFAVAQQKEGRPLREAVLEASRLRFRPILMTSFAFILGVMPLVVSTGAGANARHSIGTGVAGGMLTAALLGVLFVPLFYVTIRRLMGDKLEPPPASQ